MIVLNCPGGNTVAKWKHTLRNQNYTICSESLNRTCIVKGYEGRLSNDDSGSYYCIIAEDDIRRAVVTVLGENWAPICSTNIIVLRLQLHAMSLWI